MRTIDADDFLKQSTELYEHAGWDEREVHFSLADLRCNLEMMPTVEAEPKWIPVTEKLPPYMEEVLATTAYGDLMIMTRYPGYNGDTNPYKWTSVATAFDYEADEVKAWMPLSEPYERKEE